MELDFPGITLTQNDHALILRSERSLSALSSAVVGGGFGHVRAIINRHVDKNYDCTDPAADLRTFAAQHGITGDFVGLLTAVWLHQARAVTCRDADLTVCALITAGVSNASAAGLSLPLAPRPGTINLILLVDGQLTPGALVNAVQTVTEAKTAVLYDRGIQTAEGHPATGTSTDALVIACTGRGTEQTYAGPVTPVGYLIGRCVRECLEQALDAR